MLAGASAAGFDVFVTVDKNFRYQQNLDTLPICVLQLELVDTRLGSLLAIVPVIAESLKHTARYRFICVNDAGQIEKLSERA